MRRTANRQSSTRGFLHNPHPQQEKAAVTGGVAAARDGRYELINLGGNQVFSVAHHFVQCLEAGIARNASNGVVGDFPH